MRRVTERSYCAYDRLHKADVMDQVTLREIDRLGLQPVDPLVSQVPRCQGL